MRALWLLLLLLLARDAAGRHREDAVVQRARRLMQEWRIEEADRELRGLSAGRQRDAEVQLALGELRFLQGDYAGAAQRIREALGASGLRLPAAEVLEWRALMELAASTAEVTRNFEERRSPKGHFVLRYAAGKDALL